MGSVLLLTPQLPYPPQQGTALRNYWIVRGLAERHDVHLLSFVEDEQRAGEQEALGELAAWCREIRMVPITPHGLLKRFSKMLTDGRPDMAHRLESHAFDAALAEMLQRRISAEGDPYDIVQLEGIELARAMPVIRQSSPASRIVFDDHNAEAALQRRAFQADLASPLRWPAAVYSLVQTNRLTGFERWACRAADAVVTVSEADRKEVARLSGVPEIAVIPNCIDADDYRPTAGSPVFPFDLVFTGKMDYRPNVDAVLWFGERIWPSIVSKRPETTLAIVGQKPHRRLARLQAKPGVTITGRVERVQPYLAGAKVFIMPFRVGSGTRLKLIEAMAAGLSIVSTTVGAEGFDVTHDRELLLADTADGFASAVLGLLDSPDDRHRLGRAAEVHAAKYDWRRVIPAFEAVYAQLTQKITAAGTSER